MSWIKVLTINIGVTLSLLGCILMAPPVFFYMHSFLVGKDIAESQLDSRSKLELYQKFPWANTHFSELPRLGTTYFDFVTWRRDDFHGETINITNGIRATTKPTKPVSNGEVYYFFGGSTTWGTGVDDANTFPSIFSSKLNVEAHNFGESGYIARQSLAFLNNYLVNNAISDLSGSRFIFYDGVNDVALRCRREITGLASIRQLQIQNALRKSKSSDFSFQKTFDQLTQFIQSVVSNVNQLNIVSEAESLYNCSSDLTRANEVAQTLVETWKVASDMVEGRGGKFTAILQPVSYVGNPDTSYLYLNSDEDIVRAEQYEVVYPLIRKYALEQDIDFVDFSMIYDKCADCYIDFCHVGPQAHHILVDFLAEYFE